MLACYLSAFLSVCNLLVLITGEMEFDDPIRTKHEKHAAQHGSFPLPEAAGHAELLNEDDKQRQLTTFVSKFSDAKEPFLWGPAFMQICSTIATIHMADMSAQTNMLVLDHEPDKKDAIYVQLEDVGRPDNRAVSNLALLPPKPRSSSMQVDEAATAQPRMKRESPMDLSSAPAKVPAGDLLKAKRAQLIRNIY